MNTTITHQITNLEDITVISLIIDNKSIQIISTTNGDDLWVVDGKHLTDDQVMRLHNRTHDKVMDHLAKVM